MAKCKHKSILHFRDHSYSCGPISYKFIGPMRGPAVIRLTFSKGPESYVALRQLLKGNILDRTVKAAASKLSGELVR